MKPKTTRIQPIQRPKLVPPSNLQRWMSWIRLLEWEVQTLGRIR